MATTLNMAAFSEALVVLGTAGVVVPMVHRFGLSPVLGYLGAGALLGPLGLGAWSSDWPLLRWLTIRDAQSVSVIADLGVVFLLFLIGLELSYERLMAMRRLVFGLGGLQVIVTAGVIAGLLAAAGQDAAGAIVLAACLALSSTAVVLEVLSQQGRLHTATGRGSFAVLLAQDLAVIPILTLISILGAGTVGSLWSTLTLTAGKALAAGAFIVVGGRFVLRPLFRQVARTRSSELFIAAILFVIVGTGVVAAAADLSMALGAFVAGLLLAETEYRKTIEVTIEPFKGLLLGIFFFTVGMGIDWRILAASPLLLLAAVAGLIAVKAAIMVVLARWYRMPWPAAIEQSILLGPGGEFAFVGIGLALALGVVGKPAASFAIAVTSLSMALIPGLAMLALRLTHGDERPAEVAAALRIAPQARRHHAIVVGHGRVGKVVCQLLAEHGVAYTAIDHDAITVTKDRTAGRQVYFGDATSPEFLRACGLMEAQAVIITIHTTEQIDEILRLVRSLRPDIMVVARARDAAHARHLYSLGVTDAVPETVEASLQLSEAALVGLGIPAGPVIASIHEMRDVFRRELQQAAATAGQSGTRSIRPSTR